MNLIDFRRLAPALAALCLVAPFGCAPLPVPSVKCITISRSGEISLVSDQAEVVCRFDELAWESYRWPRPSALAISRDGVLAVVNDGKSTVGGSLGLFDCRAGARLRGVHDSIRDAEAVSWGPDGRLAIAETPGLRLVLSILSADRREIVCYETGLAVLTSSPDTAIAVSWSPEGDQIAVSLYDRNTDRCATAFCSPGGEVIRRLDGIGETRMLSGGRAVARDGRTGRPALIDLTSGVRRVRSLPNGEIRDATDAGAIILEPIWGLISISTGAAYFVDLTGKKVGQYPSTLFLSQPAILLPDGVTLGPTTVRTETD